jgi:hypothetical protein
VRLSVIISDLPPNPPPQKKNINKSSRLPPIRHLGTFYFDIKENKRSRYQEEYDFAFSK